MKNRFSYFAIVALSVIAINCSNNRSAADLLRNPERQDEILTAIANDSALLNKLHEKMTSSGKMNMMENNSMMQSCMTMMDKNPEMMGMMMDHMMMMMGENDSTMCRMMYGRMMNSPKMKGMMKGMMDSEEDNNIK